MNDWVSNLYGYVQLHAIGWATSLALGLLILFVGWVLARLAAGATRRAMIRSKATSLAPMTSTLVRISVLVATIVMALDQMGFDVTTVLAGAGVLGLAVGFGAQTLVKDCISGFFLVVEDIVQVGDWVELDGKRGVVEDVGLRMTQVRAFDGTLWSFPNGEVKTVGNLSREWMRAIVEVGIAYETDLAKGLRVLQEVGDRFAADHEEFVYRGDAAQAQGVQAFADSSVTLRLILRIDASKTSEKWPLEREMRRRIKEAFDREGVEIPFPRRVVYHRGEQGDAIADAA